MSRRHGLFAYVFAVHALFGLVAYFLFVNHRAWLFAIEAVFAISIGVGIWLLRSSFGTLDELRAASHLLRERDYTSRFREVGQPEIDAVIRVYNEMAENLRDERVRQEEKNHFVDRLVHASPSGVVTLDLAGQVVLVNPAAERILALPAPAMLTKSLTEIDHPIAAALAALEPFESRTVAADGARRIRIQRSQFLDRGFARSFFMLEEMTEELRRSERAAYEKLIRMMSHEVNNSIAASRSLLESCLHYKDQLGSEDREDFATALRVVLERTAQLGAFVKSYAEVVHLPAPRRAPTDVMELLTQITTLFREEARRREVTFRVEVGTPLPTLPVDRIQIEQVLVNVVKNALEAIESRGEVTIRTGHKDGRPRLDIEDTGAGLSDDARAKLFTPFFSTKQNGRGLGLTIAREVLLQHGFACALESSPDRGTRFTILF